MINLDKDHKYRNKQLTRRSIPAANPIERAILYGSESNGPRNIGNAMMVNVATKNASGLFGNTLTKSLLVIRFSECQ